MKQKFVFIGNSIVNGFPMSRGRSFPGRIRAAIEEDSAGFHAQIINKGVNGNTTAELMARFDHDVLDHEPTACFIMTGTNDFIYQEASPEKCFANLEAMAAKAESSDIKAIYLTPLPVDVAKASRMWMAGMGIDYDRINREIEQLTDLIRSSGRPYIDTGAVWKMALREADETGDFYIDGVHPTPEGYQLLADTVLDWLQQHPELTNTK